MLALIEAKQLQSSGGSASYAAQLFNYAKYQIDYVLGDSGRRCGLSFMRGSVWQPAIPVAPMCACLRGVIQLCIAGAGAAAGSACSGV